MEVRIPSKDEIIVRQSQMERAIQIYQLVGITPSVKELCRLSQILTQFIFTWDLDDEDLNKFSNYVKKKTSQIEVEIPS